MQDSTRIRRFKKIYISQEGMVSVHSAFNGTPFPKEEQRERHLLGDGIFDSWKEIGGG